MVVICLLVRIVILQSEVLAKWMFQAPKN
uniref:Uncharacterized protein n=1 Tax=Anguilla anguilla TaxID=7936 RepID=A0A0E9S6P5_ANGAN